MSLDPKPLKKKAGKESANNGRKKLLKSRISLTDAEFGDLDKMIFGPDRDSSRDPTINSLNGHSSIKLKMVNLIAFDEETKSKGGLDIGLRRKSCDCSRCGPLTSKEKDFLDLVCETAQDRKHRIESKNRIRIESG
jgi:hypothetical protein